MQMLMTKNFSFPTNHEAAEAVSVSCPQSSAIDGLRLEPAVTLAERCVR
jgi:hypothetical protein